jgi:hypothetical protein
MLRLKFPSIYFLMKISKTILIKLKIGILLLFSFSWCAFVTSSLPFDQFNFTLFCLGVIAGAVAGCLRDRNTVLRIFSLLLILGGMICGNSGAFTTAIAGQELIRTCQVSWLYNWFILISVSVSGMGLGWLLWSIHF